MQFSPALKAFADHALPKIEAALDRYTGSDSLPSCPEKLREAMRYSLLAPGKRLRPLLVLLSCEACGKPWEEALPAACAVEMVHAFSLIHDDLPAMDNDDLRRGKPTNHKVFGEAEALLAGDGLLALAFQVLPVMGREAVIELARAAGPSGIVGGQSDDLRGAGELRSIAERKTAALFAAACVLGGLSAAADAVAVTSLRSFGLNFGIAFQIADDLADAGKVETSFLVLGREECRKMLADEISKAKKAIEVFGEKALIKEMLVFL